MPRKVAERLGHKIQSKKYIPSDKLVLPTCNVGVEVELENMRGYRMECPLWDTKTEGSLRRGGLEYVFTSPLFGEDLITALNSLERELTEWRHTPVIDDNCSLHVHLDARDMDGEQLVKMLLLYIVYEQALYRHAAPDRENNIFCLSVNRINGNYETFASTISSILNEEETYSLMSSIDSLPRYCGLNLQALRRFGSLEFRSHRATYNKEEILTWINILMCLKAAAMSDDFDLRSYLAVKAMGHERATARIFGGYAKFITSRHLRSDVNTGLRIARNIMNYRDINNAIMEISIPGNERTVEETVVPTAEFILDLEQSPSFGETRRAYDDAINRILASRRNT